MKTSVRIKSTSGGMTVYLEPDMPFEELLSEIEKKFGESAKFFGNAKTVLSLEGRELSSTEEAKIVNVISETTQLDIVCLLEKEKPQQEPVVLPEPEVVEEEIPKEESVVFIKRTISSGETIQADKDLVIFGNVSQGATVISTNSIYIYGGLYGEAYAGVDNGNDYVIAALEYDPERVGIGKLEYHGKKASSIWKKKTHFEPQITYVKQRKIVTEQITKELLNSLL